MNTKQEKESLTNYVESLVRLGVKELEGVFITCSDKRLGKKYCLTKKVSHVLSDEVNYPYDKNLTDFKTYLELNSFLQGYLFKHDNRFM